MRRRPYNDRDDDRDDRDYEPRRSCRDRENDRYDDYDDDDERRRPRSRQGTTNGLSLGFNIAAISVGGFALIFSFIPCFGWYAIWPGGVGVLLALIGVGTNFSSPDKLAGLGWAALAISIVACGIAFWQRERVLDAVNQIRQGVPNFPNPPNWNPPQFP